MVDFDETFKKYKDCKGKFYSLFVFVVHDMLASELIEKIKHQLELLKSIKDNFKKGFLSNRLYQFRLYLEDIKDKESTIINSVFMVHDEIDNIVLPKEWKDLLLKYNVDKYIFKYNDHYDLDYLENLLTNDEYCHIIHANNNQINYYHLNKTKKKLVCSEEKKSPDIAQFMNTNNIQDKCIIHGVSVALKILKLDNKHIVINKFLKDEELINIWEQEKFKDIQHECEDILNNLTNPKFTNKLVFGKDINKKISERMIEKLFCTSDMYTKVKTLIPKDMQTFKLLEVKSFKQGDIGDTLKKNYNGGFGLMYY